MDHNISSNAASITTIAPVRPEWMSVLTMEQIKEWTEGYEMVHLIVPEGITGIHGAVDPDDCREHWLWDEWVEYVCSKIAAVTIPDSVTSIGLAAFSGCVNLTSINIPDGVTEIGAWAFYGCKSLTSINIPDSVAKIGKYAFEGCSGLAHINIPDSITTIDESVFMRCSNYISTN